MELFCIQKNKSHVFSIVSEWRATHQKQVFFQVFVKRHEFEALPWVVDSTGLRCSVSQCPLPFSVCCECFVTHCMRVDNLSIIIDCFTQEFYLTCIRAPTDWCIHTDIIMYPKWHLHYIAGVPDVHPTSWLSEPDTYFVLTGTFFTKARVMTDVKSWQMNSDGE